MPEYHVEESGPDHQKSFRAYVRIGAETYGEGEGRSKKEAEQQAAEAAWNAISERLAARNAAATAAEATNPPERRGTPRADGNCRLRSRAPGRSRTAPGAGADGTAPGDVASQD